MIALDITTTSGSIIESTSNIYQSLTFLLSFYGLLHAIKPAKRLNKR